MISTNNFRKKSFENVKQLSGIMYVLWIIFNNLEPSTIQFMEVLQNNYSEANKKV